MSVNNNRPFGLRDAKLFKITATTPTYDTGVDVPCVTSLQFDMMVTEAVLNGDDIKCSSHSILESIDVKVANGGMPLDMYALLMGATLTDSGSGSGAITFLDIAVSDVRPYMGLIARAVGTDVGGDVLLILYRAKMKSGGGGKFEKGAFFTGDFTLEALADYADSDTIMRVVDRTTATAISTTWTSNPVHASP